MKRNALCRAVAISFLCGGGTLWRLQAKNEVERFLSSVGKKTKSFFEGVAADTKDSFASFGNDLEKAGLAVKDTVVDPALTHLIACAETVGLQTELAAKTAAYEAALAGLQAAEVMAKSDPRVVGMYGAQLAREVGRYTSELGAHGITALLEGMGTITAGGFNITSITFDAYAKDLANGALPLLVMRGTFFGKEHTLSFQFDFKQPDKSMQNIVKQLLHLVM